MGFNLAFKG